MKSINPFKSIVTIVSILISTINVNGQYASGIPYRFAETDSTPPAFPTTGAVNIIIPVSAQNEWDTLIAQPGFAFKFADITYTKFFVSTNGWMALAPSGVTGSTILPTLPLNYLSNNTTGYPLIAPLWDDLSSSLISYNFTGGSLWVRWASKWNLSNAAAAIPLTYIKLNTIDNSITFYYINNVTYIPSSPSASIGIAGVCPGDFYSVFYDGVNTYVDSTAEDTTIGSIARPYNKWFRFTPISWNDQCASSTFLGTINSCLNYHASNHHSTSTTQSTCSPNDSNDVWFSFLKPTGVSGITIMTAPDSCHSVAGTSIEVYESCGSAPVACGTTSLTYPDFGSVDLFRSDTVAETLYVRVTSDGLLPGKYLICAYDDSSVTALSNFSSEKISPVIFSHGKTLTVENKDVKTDGTFEIYNLQGLKIKSGNITKGENAIQCDDLPDGIYLVNVAIGNRMISRKVLLQQ